SGRPHAPKGAEWDAAVRAWRGLPTDDEAAFDRTVRLDASALEPMITYGTNPGMGIPIRGTVPDPGGNATLQRALAYMGLQPGQPPDRGRRRRHRAHRRRPRGAGVAMERITKFTSPTVVWTADDVDTDQVIPARFLKGTARSGWGEHLFADRRYDAQGRPRPE